MTPKIALKLAKSKKDEDLNELLKAWVIALATDDASAAADDDEDFDDDHDTMRVITHELSREGDTFLGLTIIQVEHDARYDGETFHDVYAIKSSTGEVLNYFRITGAYSSWDSDDIDGEAELVTPHEIVVTQFYTKDELKHAKKDKVKFVEAK